MRRPRSRTRPSGRTPASTRSRSCRRRSARSEATAAAPRPSPSSSSATRLLEEDLVQDPKRTLERKLKEIIQSIRVTKQFSGVKGKQEIITAYLNQNYYGNQSYGVKAAVRSYFGIDLKDIDPGPGGDHRRRSPSRPRTTTSCATPRSAARRPSRRTRSARRRQLVVREDTTIVAAAQPDPRPARRRPDPDVGDAVHARRTSPPRRATEVELASQATPRWIAPHFVWAVRDELAQRVCGEDAGCDALEPRRPARHHDPRRRASRRSPRSGSQAAAIVPNAKDLGQRTAAAKALGFKKLEPWMANLHNKDLHNGALVALDYETGELVAYVGSRELLRDLEQADRSSRSTTSSARAIASPVRRSSRSTTRSASTTRRSPPARC